MIQDERDAWTMLVPAADGASGEVKVSFFGGIAFGRVGVPERTDDGVLLVASLPDLLATKLKVILQRAESKDYRDILAMLEAGGDLAAGLAAASALFGVNYQPAEALRALVFFRDGDLPSLTDREQRALVRAATAVRGLPAVPVRGTTLGGGDAEGGA